MLEDSGAAQEFIASVTEKMQAAPAGVLLNEAIAAGLNSSVSQTKANSHIDILTGAEAIDDNDYFCYRNTVLQTSAAAIRADDRLQVEHFGPVTLFVVCEDMDDLRATVDALEGNLTTTVHAEDSELADIGGLLHQLREKSRACDLEWLPNRCRRRTRPCSTADPTRRQLRPARPQSARTRFTALCGPIAFQNVPDALLPDPLKDANPLGIMRLVDDVYKTEGL